MNENPLAPIGDLSKSATALIKLVHDLLGGFIEPHRIVRVAKAEAKAELIRAEGEVEAFELRWRGINRFIAEEERKQANIESILTKSLPYLNDDSDAQAVEKDWVTNFFEKSRIVSDEEMQELWARILAGEANSPGAFAKKTVNLLADLDKIDAERFTTLCRFNWVIHHSYGPLIFDVTKEPYMSAGLSYSSVAQLVSLGLIDFSDLAEVTLTKLPPKITASYFGRSVDLTLKNDTENNLGLGSTRLTRAGLQLARVIPAAPIEGFFEFIHERWIKRKQVQGTEIKSDS